MIDFLVGTAEGTIGVDERDFVSSVSDTDTIRVWANTGHLIADEGGGRFWLSDGTLKAQIRALT